nr:hypothetical protein [Tanacetum cinerariifolium]
MPNDVIRCITFDLKKLDGEAGFGDVEGSNLDNSGLSHDECFGVDDLDLNVNLNLDLNGPQHATHEEVFVSEVPNDHVVNKSNTCVDGKPIVDVGRTKEHVVKHIRGTYDEDDVLVYKERKIVEPDVEVHVFGIIKDVSMNKAFRVKAKVEREVKGDHTLEYAMLRYYVVELQSTTLNTTIKITDERNTDSSLSTSMFKSNYVCLGSLNEGLWLPEENRLA